MAYTLLQLRDRAREIADQAGVATSRFVEDGSLDKWINEGYASLYNKLVTLYEDFFVTSTNVTLVPGTIAYSLAAVVPAVFKLRGVDRVWSATDPDDFSPMKKYEWGERGRANRATMDASNVLRAPSPTEAELGYLYRGSSIEFRPAAAITAGTARIHYVPRLTALAADASQILAEVQEGWEEYIVLKAAYKMLLKEQNPGVKDILSALGIISNEIDESAPERDAEQPERGVASRRAREERGG